MMNSYPWYLADWFSSEKVASFSLESRAIYRELIDHCWNNGSLPNDEKILQNLARCTAAEWRRNRAAVLPCFELKDDNRLHLHKVDEKRPGIVQAKENRIKGAEVTNSKRKRPTVTDTMTATVTETVTDTVIPCARARTPSPSPSPHPTDVIPPLPPKGAPVAWRDDPAFAAIVSEMFLRHRQGRKTTLDETGRALMLKIEGAVHPIRAAQGLNQRHRAWCESDDWTREAGRYVPWLGKWIQSPKSDAEPPAPAGDPEGGDEPCY